MDWLTLALFAVGGVMSVVVVRDLAIIRDLSGRLAKIRAAAIAGDSCNLCGAPRCLHCNAHLDGSRADGYCSDGCANGPTKVRDPLGIPRGPGLREGERSRADRFLDQFGD